MDNSKLILISKKFKVKKKGIGVGVGVGEKTQ